MSNNKDYDGTFDCLRGILKVHYVLINVWKLIRFLIENSEMIKKETFMLKEGQRALKAPVPAHALD